MRILFFGDNQSTGFGTVTRDLGSALLDIGEDVRFLSQNSGGQMAEPFHSRTYDMTTFAYHDGEVGVVGVNDLTSLLDGTAEVNLHSGEPSGAWSPEVILLVGDFYSIRIIIEGFPEVFSGRLVFHYAPIEGVGLPPLWKATWDIASPVAMSEFGADQIAIVTGVRPPVIHHGVNTTDFYPVSSKRPITLAGHTLTSKADCKLAWSGQLDLDPRLTWLLRTDRNMPRKRYPALIRSLAPVLARNPNLALVIHALDFDQGGFISDSLSKLSPNVRARVKLTGTVGHARDLLSALYNAADLYVSNSAEGFGLTIAEALACGVPAVGADYSAVPEVIGPAGVTVPVAHLLDNEYDHAWCAVDEVEFARRVEFLAAHQTRREDLGRKGPAHVAARFRWDAAAAAFADLFHSASMTSLAA
jgi:glycosyltransferase involved in cell wall biosynthesis